MPFCNRFDPRKLLRSRKLEEKSYKNGLRHGIFNGVYDKYTGAWIHDKKTGRLENSNECFMVISFGTSFLLESDR